MSLMTALALLTILLAVVVFVMNIVRWLRNTADKPNIFIDGDAVNWAQVTEVKPTYISFLNPQGREVTLVFRDPEEGELKLESIRCVGNNEARTYATIETQVLGSEASVPRLTGATLRGINFNTTYEDKPRVRLTFGKGSILFPSESHSVNVEIVEATVENTRPR